jgi:G3E family GTPase
VIVNESGKIGLDRALASSSTDNVVLLEAGCLCCAIADSQHETLTDLYFRRVRGEVSPALHLQAGSDPDITLAGLAA